MDFAHFWQYTDAVSKSLFFVLIALSIASWIVGISKILQARSLAKKIADDLSSYINARLSNVAVADKAVAEQLLLARMGQYRFDSERGLSVLGTTAAIAPFVGLFGTVWGIFHALTSIGNSGQAGLAQVAGPVGEALIMTGLGLGVAIPAVVFYNIIMRQNRHALHIAQHRAHEILASVAGGE